MCTCVYVEPDATAPADPGAGANTGAAGAVAAELGSDQRHFRGDHGTLHAARRPGAGAPKQEEPHHRGQRPPDRLPGVGLCFCFAVQHTVSTRSYSNQEHGEDLQ